MIKKEKKTRILKHLLLEAKPFWLAIPFIFLLELLATPLAVLMPVPMKIVVDSVLGTDAAPNYIAFIISDRILQSGQTLLIFVVLMQIGVVFLQQLQFILQASDREKLN